MSAPSSSTSIPQQAAFTTIGKHRLPSCVTLWDSVDLRTISEAARTQMSVTRYLGENKRSSFGKFVQCAVDYLSIKPLISNSLEKITHLSASRLDLTIKSYRDEIVQFCGNPACSEAIPFVMIKDLLLCKLASAQEGKEKLTSWFLQTFELLSFELAKQEGESSSFMNEIKAQLLKDGHLKEGAEGLEFCRLSFATLLTSLKKEWFNSLEDYLFVQRGLILLCKVLAKDPKELLIPYDRLGNENKLLFAKSAYVLLQVFQDQIGHFDNALIIESLERYLKICEAGSCDPVVLRMLSDRIALEYQTLKLHLNEALLQGSIPFPQIVLLQKTLEEAMINFFRSHLLNIENSSFDLQDNLQIAEAPIPNMINVRGKTNSFTCMIASFKSKMIPSTNETIQLTEIQKKALDFWIDPKAFPKLRPLFDKLATFCQNVAAPLIPQLHVLQSLLISTVDKSIAKPRDSYLQYLCCVFLLLDIESGYIEDLSQIDDLEQSICNIFYQKLNIQASSRLEYCRCALEKMQILLKKEKYSSETGKKEVAEGIQLLLDLVGQESTFCLLLIPHASSKQFRPSMFSIFAKEFLATAHIFRDLLKKLNFDTKMIQEIEDELNRYIAETKKLEESELFTRKGLKNIDLRNSLKSILKSLDQLDLIGKRIIEKFTVSKQILSAQFSSQRTLLSESKFHLLTLIQAWQHSRNVFTKGYILVTGQLRPTFIQCDQFIDQCLQMTKKQQLLPHARYFTFGQLLQLAMNDEIHALSNTIEKKMKSEALFAISGLFTTISQLGLVRDDERRAFVREGLFQMMDAMRIYHPYPCLEPFIGFLEKIASENPNLLSTLSFVVCNEKLEKEEKIKLRPKLQEGVDAWMRAHLKEMSDYIEGTQFADFSFPSDFACTNKGDLPLALLIEHFNDLVRKLQSWQKSYRALQNKPSEELLEAFLSFSDQKFTSLFRSLSLCELDVNALMTDRNYRSPFYQDDLAKFYLSLKTSPDVTSSDLADFMSHIIVRIRVYFIYEHSKSIMLIRSFLAENPPVRVKVSQTKPEVRLESAQESPKEATSIIGPSPSALVTQPNEPTLQEKCLQKLGALSASYMRLHERYPKSEALQNILIGYMPPLFEMAHRPDPSAFPLVMRRTLALLVEKSLELWKEMRSSEFFVGHDLLNELLSLHDYLPQEEPQMRAILRYSHSASLYCPLSKGVDLMETFLATLTWLEKIFGQAVIARGVEASASQILPTPPPIQIHNEWPKTKIEEIRIALAKIMKQHHAITLSPLEGESSGQYQWRGNIITASLATLEESLLSLESLLSIHHTEHPAFFAQSLLLTQALLLEQVMKIRLALGDMPILSEKVGANRPLAYSHDLETLGKPLGETHPLLNEYKCVIGESTRYAGSSSQNQMTKFLRQTNLLSEAYMNGGILNQLQKEKLNADSLDPANIEIQLSQDLSCLASKTTSILEYLLVQLKIIKALQEKAASESEVFL